MGNPQDVFKKELSIFASHREEFCKTHLGQHVLIQGNRVVGFFATTKEAVAIGNQTRDKGLFFVKEIKHTDKVPNFTRLQFA